MPSLESINSALHRNIRTGKEFEKYMPFSDCSSVRLGRGTTDFGIKAMAKWVKKYQHHTKNLAPKLKRSSLIETCKTIKDFVYWHFQYKIDGNTQQLRSPACAWVSRDIGIDCKSYSIFVSTVLLNLGIPHYLRRIKQNNDFPDVYTHVYVVVPKDGKNLKNGYYTIDGTIETFAEPPYLTSDEVFINPTENKGLGFLSSNYTPVRWNRDLQERRFPFVHFENAHLLKAMGDPNIHIPSSSLENVTDATINGVMALVETKSMLIKQQSISIVNMISGTTSSVAEGVAVIFPPVAPISVLISTAVEVVGLLVDLWIMFGYDPCAGAEYVASEIGYRLKREFVPNFKRCSSEIEDSLKKGTASGVGIALNEMLKEVDLGLAHYENELKYHNGNKCSKEALAGFNGFVKAIKSTTDNLYVALKAFLKRSFKITETNKFESTSNRSWYFIVPVTKNAINAYYRSVRISSWNENLKEYYPFAVDYTFNTWAVANKNYLNTIYHDGRGNQYLREIKPFESKISQIRDNIYVSSAIRYEEEKRLREREMLPIYLKYDTDYANTLKRSLLDEANSFNQRMHVFLQELKEIVEIKISQVRREQENINIIADSNNRHALKMTQRQIMGATIIGIIALMTIKTLKNE